MNKTILLFLFSCHAMIAQNVLTWEDFGDVEFAPEYNEKYDVHFLMPTFGEKIKSFKDQEITVSGYFLDISGTGEIYMVSANPMASCFFCGAAGPESIVEVQFKEDPPFKTDDVVVVTGVLELNRGNVDHCNYILKDAIGKLKE